MAMRLPRFKIPLVVFTLLIFAGLAAYIVHVQQRKSYLMEWNFRRLAAMSQRIDNRLALYRHSIFVLVDNPEYTLAELEKILHFEALGSFGREEGAPPPTVAIESRTAKDRTWFYFLVPREGTTPQFEARYGVRDLVEPAIDLGEFDKLVFATAAGRVLFEEGRKDISLVDLGGIETLDHQPLNLSQLSRATSRIDVQISGERYHLLVQPLVTVAHEGAVTADGSKDGWVLCGLIQADRLNAQASEISPVLLIVFIAGLLLAALSWPFVRLMTMSSGERLRAIDGLLVSLCALIGLSTLVVLLLDGIVFQRLSRSADSQLQTLTLALRDQLEEELDEALKTASYLNRLALGEMQAPPVATLGAIPGRQAVCRLPGDFRYPNFFWADGSGLQVLKWQGPGREAPLATIGQRVFFRNAVAGRLDSRKVGGEVYRFTAEPAVGWRVGETFLQVALPVRRDGPVSQGNVAPSCPEPAILQGARARAKVAVLTTRLQRLVDPVLPPGFNFAVVDRSGRVLFHSDGRRSLQENFLSETSSRELRSLLFAQKSGFVKVRYAGEPVRAYPVPVQGLQWSIIGYRELGILQTANIQVLCTALVFLICYASVFFLLASGVYLAPVFRARWIWPAKESCGTYLQLAITYLALLLLYALALVSANGVFLFWSGMLMPVLVIAVSYLKVHWESVRRLSVYLEAGRVASRKGFRALAARFPALAVRFRALAARFRAFAARFLPSPAELPQSSADPGSAAARSLSPEEKARFEIQHFLALTVASLILIALLALVWRNSLSTGFLFTAAITGILLFLFSARSSRLFARIAFPRYRTAYLITGWLLLVILAIPPAASFFKLAVDLPVEDMVKHGQLQLLADLTRQPSLLGAGKGALSLARVPSANAEAFFHTRVRLYPRGLCESGNVSALLHESWISHQVERLLPLYNRTSTEMARLVSDFEPGRGWQWSHHGDRLVLHGAADAAGNAVHLESVLPSLGLDLMDWTGLGAGLVLIALLALLIIWFVARNLLLLNLSIPVWLDRAPGRLKTAGSAPGANLIYVSRRPERLEIKNSSTAAVVDLAAQQKEVSEGTALDQEGLAGRAVVFVSRFEYRLKDAAFNEAKLRLLEDLLKDAGRRVIVLSAWDPHFCLLAGTLASAASLEEEPRRRWLALLGRFEILDLDEPGDPAELEPALKDFETRQKRLPAWWLDKMAWQGHVANCVRILREECAGRSALHGVCKEMMDDLVASSGLETMDGEQILEEIRDRADSYYRALWSSLAQPERVALVQLAEEGLVNPKSRRSLQRLISRRLVRSTPAPMLMNRTFRRFVMSPACRPEVLDAERESGEKSLWGRLRKPMIAAFWGAALFFYITQREVFDSSLLVLSATAGALPHLLELVGYFGAAKTSAEAESYR